MKKIKVLLGDALFVAFFEYLFHELKVFEYLKEIFIDNNIKVKEINFGIASISLLNIFIFIILTVIGYFIFFFLIGHK